MRRIFRNLSWALLILKARSGLEQISRHWSFFTLFTTPSTRGLFLATIRRPEQGRGLADILLPPSICPIRNAQNSNWGFGYRGWEFNYTWLTQTKSTFPTPPYPPPKTQIWESTTTALHPPNPNKLGKFNSENIYIKLIYTQIRTCYIITW